MQLATCFYRGERRTAVRDEDELKLFAPGIGIEALLCAPDEVILDRLGSTEPVAPDEVTFDTPISSPGKIICVGLNYRDHAAEAAADIPPKPSLFIRFRDSLVGHLEPIIVPSNSDNFDFEGELAVVIGRTARHVAEADALDFVAGYACFADNSVRDFQMHSRQITPGKNFPSSGAFGPWLTTAAAVGDPARLELTTKLNGAVVQHAPVSDLIYSIPFLISYISSFTPLAPGDVIATGTPSGVGVSRKPPLWMKAGDVLEIEIPGVGALRNTVAAEAAHAKVSDGEHQ
jgi:2-keto-4-pentenoate hydratase/2-oxohepta-3-ene-1,7-dioic acid hydratase in catechol pathway